MTIFQCVVCKTDCSFAYGICAGQNAVSCNQTVINIQKMGAKGNGTSDCLPAFRKAFKKAAKLGGARIVVPTGTYYIKGPLHLVSNVCLEIQEGATLKFAPEPEYYLPAVKTSWEGTFVQNYRHYRR